MIGTKILILVKRCLTVVLLMSIYQRPKLTSCCVVAVTRDSTSKCFDCKANVKKNEDDSSVQEDGSSNSAVVPGVTAKLATEESMKGLFDSFSKEITRRLNDFEESLKYHSKDVESLLTSFKDMKKGFETIQVKHQMMEKENAELKKCVQELKIRIIERDQKDLDRNLEIKGIPETFDDSKKIMDRLCRKAGVSSPAEHTYFQCGTDEDGTTQ